MNAHRLIRAQNFPQVGRLPNRESKLELHHEARSPQYQLNLPNRLARDLSFPNQPIG